MTDVIQSTPLSQLSEAGMCKTSRLVEQKLGGMLTKGEVKSPNLVDKKLTAYLIATCDLPTKPKVGDKITDIYLGVEDSVEVLEVTHYEAQGEVCMWRVLCVRV